MQIWAHAIYLILLTCAVLAALTYRRMARNANDVTTQTLSHLEHDQSTARAFLDAGRLIGISRQGRMNVFTFARGNKIFTIETMGIMSDEPDVWREQAGLITNQPKIQTFGE